MDDRKSSDPADWRDNSFKSSGEYLQMRRGGWEQSPRIPRNAEERSYSETVGDPTLGIRRCVSVARSMPPKKKAGEECSVRVVARFRPLSKAVSEPRCPVDHACDNVEDDCRKSPEARRRRPRSASSRRRPWWSTRVTAAGSANITTTKSCEVRCTTDVTGASSLADPPRCRRLHPGGDVRGLRSGTRPRRHPRL